jgi:hypothetical protein
MVSSSLAAAGAVTHRDAEIQLEHYRKIRPTVTKILKRECPTPGSQLPRLGVLSAGYCTLRVTAR